MGFSDKSPKRAMVDTTIMIITYMVVYLYIGLNVMGYGVDFLVVISSVFILFVALMGASMLVDYLDGKLTRHLKTTIWYQAELEAEDRVFEESERMFAERIQDKEDWVENTYGLRSEEIRVLRVDLMDKRDLEYLGEAIKRKGV